MRISTNPTNFGKLWRVGCAMTLLCFQTSISQAQGLPLAPGGSVPGVLIPPTGGTLLADQYSPFGTASFSGLLSSSVYVGDPTNPYGAGDLTFVYQLLIGVGPDSASAVSIGPFTGFLTAVGYNPGGMVVPGTISRNPSGSQAVKFDFSTTGYVMPGQNSVLLVVQTDATAYTLGNATVLDSTGSPNVPALVPTAVPEPASLGLITLSLSALAGYRRWKK